jgi:hypothetical protein
MRKLNVFTLLTSLIVLFNSCDNSRNEIVPETLFNIDNLKNISIKSITDFKNDNLNKQGYRRIATDVVVFNKKVKDTTTQLFFEIDFGRVLSKIWYINLGNSNDKSIVEEILYKHEILMMSDFTYCSENKDSYFFPALDSNKNIIFLCKVYKDNDDYILKVTYRNQITTFDYKDRIDAEFDKEL